MATSLPELPPLGCRMKGSNCERRRRATCARSAARKWPASLAHGGWGVDALLAEQTRQHDDMDIVVEFTPSLRTGGLWGRLGFHLAEDYLPTRAVLRSSDGRQIHLHPVVLAEDGTGWQRGASPDGSDLAYPAEGFGNGRIRDRAVPCLTAGLQLEHHRGYERRRRTSLTWCNSLSASTSCCQRPTKRARTAVLRRLAEWPRRPNGFAQFGSAGLPATRRPRSPCRGRRCPAGGQASCRTRG